MSVHPKVKTASTPATAGHALALPVN
jgi:hypothetical protein